MRIATDIDGCLCDFGGEVIKMANRLLNKNLPANFVTQNWNWSDVLTSDEWSQVWNAMMDIEDFWLGLAALPGTRELHAFLAQNHDAQVYFITSRKQPKGQTVIMQTTQWLERHGLWPRFDRSKVIVTEASNKWKYLKALEIQWYVDDYAPTIAGLQTSQEGLNAYLLDAPYNQYAVSLPRVFSMSEYLKQVK